MRHHNTQRAFATRLRGIAALLHLSGLLLGVGSCTGVADKTKPQAGVTTVYVVRHAEKAKSPRREAELTSAGRMRARALANALERVPLDAVYATEYRRTQQTVAPLAAAQGLDVDLVRSSESQALADRIKRRHGGKRVVVASHSNVIPAVLAALGVQSPVSIGNSDYGDLFVVVLNTDGRAELQRRRFGD